MKQVNTYPSAALALSRYLGDEFEAYQRPSGIYGVRRKPLSTTPNYGTTVVKPLTCGPVYVGDSPCIEAKDVPMFRKAIRIPQAGPIPARGIPQGQVVPY